MVKRNFIVSHDICRKVLILVTSWHVASVLHNKFKFIISEAHEVELSINKQDQLLWLLLEGKAQASTTN